MGKPAFILAAAAAFSLAVPAAAVAADKAPAKSSAKAKASRAEARAKRPSPAPLMQTVSCADGTTTRAPANSNPCRSHGGIFAASATKVITTPADSANGTTLVTKLPASPPARTIATTVNNGDKRATTEVTQISTPGAAPVSLRPSKAEITVRCYDNTVLKVTSVKGACKRRGGVASSVTTAVMRVPAGASKAIAAKTPTGVAVVATDNAPGQASATRVTQTTVYAPPPKR